MFDFIWNFNWMFKFWAYFIRAAQLVTNSSFSSEYKL